MMIEQKNQIFNSTVVEHDGKFANHHAKFGSFIYDIDNNIVGISGRSLKVVNLSDNKETYFQAWVDGYQNDGLSHNEAVNNALKLAQENSSRIKKSQN
ncbi:hypothetical protein [Pseudoalteromonas luteoviolacea]|uniref:Uncharacterized protein n=1 Tax=Pseudoalteromonas luteoviolacea S4060-1 TaxID=1365257 RepID=A0A167KVJ8_9GAMM|nr:hypothetical protein [Pseudoalteromonas luteoviolacea]KZN63351.1 hypothetical protein N478_03615 [Pseudoalteromonas luteoviolacea S4060-1]